MPGHPDGQNYAIWRGPQFGQSNSATVTQANGVHLNGQTTNFASLSVQVTNETVPNLTVVISFWVDAAHTQVAGQFTWSVPTGSILPVIVPALSNYATIDITTTDVTGGLVVYAVLPTNTPVAKPEYPFNGNIQQNNSFTSPANNTTLFILPAIVPGNGYVFVQDINSSTKLFFAVLLLNPDGTAGPVLVNIPAPVTFSGQSFFAPDTQLALRVQNTDGAASHPCRFVLWTDGR